MTEALWLAGLLFGNLWATGNTTRTVYVPDGGTVIMAGQKFVVPAQAEPWGSPILNRIPYVNRLVRNIGYTYEAVPVPTPLGPGQRLDDDATPDRAEILRALPQPTRLAIYEERRDAGTVIMVGQKFVLPLRIQYKPWGPPILNGTSFRSLVLPVGGLVGGLIGSDLKGREARDKAIQAQIAAQATKQMRINDVVQMAQQGNSDAVIINRIIVTGSVFDLTPEDVNYIDQQLVSKAVIEVMQGRRYRYIEARPLCGTSSRMECSFTDRGKGWYESCIECEPEARVVACWDNRVRFVKDTFNPSIECPGITSSVYLYSKETERTIEARGRMEVEAFDMAPALRGEKPRLLAKWTFDADTLKTLKRKDMIGEGYTLAVYWTDIPPNVENIKLQTVYVPENGASCSDEPTYLARRNTESDRTVSNPSKVVQAQAVSNTGRSRKLSLDDVIRLSKSGVREYNILVQIETTESVFTVTMEDVVRLAKNHVSDTVIAEVMKTSTFDVTVDDIISLTQQGLSDAIIGAMQRRKTP